MRTIDTGRGLEYTTRTPSDIAAMRAAALTSLRDQGLYLDTFTRVRMVAVDLPDLDALWTIAGGSWIDPVTEAAMIEALASLRAEKRLP